MNLPASNEKISFPGRFNKSKPKIKLWHKLLFLSPVLIIVMIFKGNEWYGNYRLKNNGKSTFAVITYISTSGVRDPLEIDNVAFEYIAGDSVYTGYTIAQTNNSYAFANNGLPLSTGDRYKIIYVSDNPDIYEIDLKEPDPQTLIYYLNQAAKVIGNQKIFSDCKDEEKSIACFVQNVFLKFSYDGLATILFYDEYIAENISHNAITFKRFMKKKEVKELIKKCSE